MAEDKSAGVEFVTMMTGFDQDGNAVTIQGTAANRALAFGNEFVITKDTSVNPNVIRIGLREDLAAIVALLDGTGTITVDRLIVHTIQAKGTGSAPDIGVPDLLIVTKSYPGNFDQPCVWFTGGNDADIDLGGRISWFGGTTNKQQTLPGGYVLGDLVARFENYNLVVTV